MSTHSMRGLIVQISSRARLLPILVAAWFFGMFWLAASAQDIVRLPGILPDTDKYAKDQGNDAFVWGYREEVDPQNPDAVRLLIRFARIWALAIPQDLNGNRIQDGDEDWSETREINGVPIEGFWSVWHDNSCWAAGANNMAQTITGISYYHSWMYLEGVPTLLGVGGRSYWYDGGDQIHEPLDYEDLENDTNYADNMLNSAWDTNPESWIHTCLQGGKPVGASIEWDLGEGHVITLYGMDVINKRLWIVDSDSDDNGDKPYWMDYRFYHYDAINDFFQIKWDGSWYDMNTFNSFLSRRWSGFPNDGFAVADNWDGEENYPVWELRMYGAWGDRTVRTAAHSTITRLVMMDNGMTLAIEPTGRIDLRTFMLSLDAHLNIEGTFTVAAQQTVDGTVNLLPGGSWTSPTGTMIVGAQGEGLVDQTGGTASTWSLILGHETWAEGNYWLSGGTLSYGQFIIGDEGRGELGIGPGTQLLRNTEAQGQLGSGSFDPDTSAITLGNQPLSRGDVTMPGGTVTTNWLTVGAQGEGGVEQSGGTVTVLDDLVLGQMGWFTVPSERDSSRSSVVASGNYALDGDGVLYTSRTLVGRLGNGTFVQDDTSLHDTDFLILGYRRDESMIHPSRGEYFLNSGQLGVGKLFLGIEGIGLYEQSGGTASIGEVRIGSNTHGDGELNVVGGALSIDDLTIVHGQLGLDGSGGIVVAGSAVLAGTTSQAGTSVFVAAKLTLNGEGSTNNEYVLSGGTLSVVHDETVGGDGVFAFNHAGGTHRVAETLTLATGGGSYKLSGGTLETDRTILGDTGLFTLEQSDGSAALGQSLVLGRGADGDGRYLLSGGDLVVDALVLGQEGLARFEQTGGTATISSQVDLAPDLGTGLTGSSGSLLWVKGGVFDAGDVAMSAGFGAACTVWFGETDYPGSRTIIANALSIGPHVLFIADGDHSLNCFRINRLNFQQMVQMSEVGLQLGHPGGVGNGSLLVHDSLEVGDLFIGHSATAEVQVFADGSLAVGNDLAVGHGAAQQGSLTIDGETTVTGDVRIGDAGVGSVTHATDTLSIGGDLVLGCAADSQGNYELQAGTIDGSGGLRIGEAGDGQLTQYGGSATFGGSLVLGVLAEAQGTLRLEDGEFRAARAFVGQAGSGTFAQTGGTSFFFTSFHVSPMGDDAALASLEGGSLTTPRLEIGSEAGTGTFDWRAGSLIADALAIDPHGTLAIGHGWPYSADWELAGALDLKGKLDAPGHTLLFKGTNQRIMNRATSVLNVGDLRLSNDGALPAVFGQTDGQATIGLLEIGGEITGGGQYVLSGGTLAAAAVVVDGRDRASRFDFAGGTLEAGQVRLLGNATMTAADDWTFAGELAIEGGEVVMGNAVLTLLNADENWDDDRGLDLVDGQMALDAFVLLGSDSHQQGGAIVVSQDTTLDNGFLEQNGGTFETLDFYLARTPGKDYAPGYALVDFNGGTTVASNLLVAYGEHTEATVSLMPAATLSTQVCRVGIGGTAYFDQVGGTHTVEGTLTVGESVGVTPERGPGDDGTTTYRLRDGTLTTNRSRIGIPGWGLFWQTGGLHEIATSLDVGPWDQVLENQGKGRYTMDGGRLEVPLINLGGQLGSSGRFSLQGGDLVTDRIHAVGWGVFSVGPAWEFDGITIDLDEGEFSHEDRAYLKASTITLRDGYWSGATLRLESTVAQPAILSGYGWLDVREFQNAGQVIADGFGEEQVLDLYYTGAVVRGEAAASGPCGWYARKHGILAFPPVLFGWDQTYTVGDDPANLDLELVNSVRMTVADVSFGADNGLQVQLLATDCDSIPEAPVRFIGVWDFVLPDGMTVPYQRLTFRYDDAQLSILGITKDDLKVYRFNGAAWTDVTDALDAEHNCISSLPDTSFSLYAVGAVVPPVTLTYLAGDHGSIEGPTPQTVERGEEGAAVTARPDPNYHFVQWSDGRIDNPRQEKVASGDLTVTAEFAIDTYTVAFLPGEHGSLTGGTPTVVVTVNTGDPAPAAPAVTPDEGWTFAEWVPALPPTITGNAETTAQYARIMLQLAYTTGAGGSISGESTQTVAFGEDGTAVTAVPDKGYMFLQWNDDLATATRQELGVTADLMVKAQFVLLPNLEPPILDLDTGTAGVDCHVAHAVADGPVLASIRKGLALTDPDSLHVVAATVSIQNLLDGTSESLSVTARRRAVTATYDDVTGILSLVGQASLEEYQVILESVVYENTSPTPDTTPREIVLVVDDGAWQSAPATCSVFLTDDDLQYWLEPGWNLLSSPFDMVPWVPVAAGFCDGDGQPLVLAPVLTRDPALGDYQAVLTGATAGQGFWARCRNEIHDAGVESAPVPGRLRDGIVRLKPGWNMVGPAADLPVEEVRAVAGVQGPVWYWEQTMLCYVAVPDGSVLTRGRGYWIYATQDVNITPLRAAGRD